MARAKLLIPCYRASQQKNYAHKIKHGSVTTQPKFKIFPLNLCQPMSIILIAQPINSGDDGEDEMNVKFCMFVLDAWSSLLVARSSFYSFIGQSVGGGLAVNYCIHTVKT